MKKRKAIILTASLAAGAVCFLLTVDSKAAVEAARKSVETCLSVIIPSLFAFMVFSRIVIKSGIADTALFPLYKLSSFWFKGNRRDFSIFILSLIGGYPVGISLLKEEITYNKNYTAIAEKMLCFCYCGSPSFIIQIAGISVLGSAKAGLIIYLSNVLACFTMAVFVNIFEMPKRPDYEAGKSNPKLTLADFTDSISSAVKSLSVICGTILAFNIVLELLNYIGAAELMGILGVDKAAAAAFEISNLSLLKGEGRTVLPLLSGLTSFGGLCIIMQTAALSDNKIPLKKFMLFRIPTALLSSLYGSLLLYLFPVAIEAYLPQNTVTVMSSVNPICSLCIAAMTYILLKTKKDTGRFEGNNKK